MRHPGPAFRHQDRAQEHELLPLPASRPGVRDRAADRHAWRPASAWSRRPCTSTPTPAGCPSLRSKEEAHDYRYFPEPDLPPIELDADYVERVRASLPELPAARKERHHGAVRADGQGSGPAGRQQAAGRLLRDPGRHHRRPAGRRSTGCWATCPRISTRRASRWPTVRCSRRRWPSCSALLKDGTLSGKMAKEVFEAMCETGKPAKDDRRREGPGPDLRHERAGGHRGPHRGGQPRTGRGVQAGPGQGPGLLRGPDNERDQRSGQPAGGQRAAT